MRVPQNVVDLCARFARIGGIGDVVDWNKLSDFKQLLRFYGRSVNLVGGLEGLDDQLLEGLVTGWVGGPGVWVDVGSGGGLPGLVVACMEGRQLHLVEPRGRRVDFLELVVGRLRVPAKVVRARWEGGEFVPLGGQRVPDFGAFCAVGTSRAVWPPEAWVGIGSEILASGALVVAHERADTPALGVAEREERVGDWAIRAYRVPRGT